MPHHWWPVFKVLYFPLGLPQWLSGKESASQCRRRRRFWFDPWVRKIPWRRKWQPTPVYLPGESHGQRGLVAIVHGVGLSKELDMTEQLTLQLEKKPAKQQRPRTAQNK